MIILGLDCATGPLSAAFVAGNRVLAEHRAPGPTGQAEILLPVIERLRREVGLEWSAVDRLAVTLGPGSFTGVRIALAAARGLALAIARPIIGFSTLEAVALALPPDPRPLVVALDARRGQIYAQPFRADGSPLAPPDAVTPAAVAAALPPGPVRLAGSGAALVAAASGRTDLALAPLAVPDAAAMARAAQHRPEPPRAAPEPIYLRGADARLAGNRVAPPRVAAAGLAHCAVLAALHAAIFPEDPWSEGHLARLLALPGSLALMAFEAAEPIGLALARVAGDEAELLTIGVRAARRGAGHGRLLLDAVRVAAAAAGAQNLFLEVATDNHVARHLYARAGFATAGHRPAYYRRSDGRTVDALVLRDGLI